MNPTVLALTASASLSASILSLVYWFVAVRRAARLRARVATFASTAQSVEEYELSQPFMQRFLLPVGTVEQSGTVVGDTLVLEP